MTDSLRKFDKPNSIFDLKTLGPRTGKLIEKFWRKVFKKEGCWEWLGSKEQGYGKFCYNYMVFKAHRVVLELTEGKIPENKVIDHLCRNRSCVNPSHLEIVSLKDNLKRRVGACALNARKTHCPQGHPYNKENTYIPKNTIFRSCRLCTRERQRRSKRWQTK